MGPKEVTLKKLACIYIYMHSNILFMYTEYLIMNNISIRRDICSNIYDIYTTRETTAFFIKARGLL